MVWYLIQSDVIFMDSRLDSLFFSLQPLYWDKLLLLGEL